MIKRKRNYKLLSTSTIYALQCMVTFRKYVIHAQERVHRRNARSCFTYNYKVYIHVIVCRLEFDHTKWSSGWKINCRKRTQFSSDAHDVTHSNNTPVAKTTTLRWLFNFLLAELLLWYLTGNILGIEVSFGRHADDVQMTCGWHADDLRMTWEWDFGWDFTGGWHMSSGMSSRHLPELPNFMQYYTWCHLHVIRSQRN